MGRFFILVALIIYTLPVLSDESSMESYKYSETIINSEYNLVQQEAKQNFNTIKAQINTQIESGHLQGTVQENLIKATQALYRQALVPTAGQNNYSFLRERQNSSYNFETGLVNLHDKLSLDTIEKLYVLIASLKYLYSNAKALSSKTYIAYELIFYLNKRELYASTQILRNQIEKVAQLAQHNAIQLTKFNDADQEVSGFEFKKLKPQQTTLVCKLLFN